MFGLSAVWNGGNEVKNMKAKMMDQQAMKTEELQAAPDRSFYVLASQSGKALTVSETGEVVLSELKNNKNQAWKFQYVEKTEYHLVCEETGKALDVVALGTENGTPVQQWDALNSESQTWTVLPYGDVQKNQCQIISKLSGRVLDIAGMSQEDGAHLQIWDNLQGENQIWVLKEIEQPAAKKPATRKRTAGTKKTETKTAAKTGGTKTTKTAASKTKKTTAKSTSKSTKSAAKTSTPAKESK